MGGLAAVILSCFHMVIMACVFEGVFRMLLVLRHTEPRLESFQPAKAAVPGVSFWRWIMLFKRRKGDVNLDSLHVLNKMLWLLYLAGS